MSQNDPIRDLLLRARTIAVVGCSPRPARDSHRIAAYLLEVGYRVVPVNPGHDAILGQRCYPDLRSIPHEVAVDIVDVFRRPEEVPAVAEAAVERGAGALWLQLGVANAEAERLAAEAGLEVISDRCIMVEHRLRSGAMGR